MNQADADDRPKLPKQGFHIEYRSGDFEHSLHFADTTCSDAIEYITRFMLGCGFDPRVVASGLKESARKIT